MRKLLTFLLIQTVTVFSAPLEPITFSYDLKLAETSSEPEEHFTIFVIRPVEPSNLLKKAEPELRRVILGEMRKNRLETDLLLSHAAYNIRRGYRSHRRDWTAQDEAWLELRLRDIQSGLSPVVLITHPKDPFIVYLTAAVGYDWDGNGLPSEHFGKSVGMPPLNLPPINERVARTPIYHIPHEGELRFDEYVSTVLSELPHIVGGRSELRFFTSPSHCHLDLAPILHRIIVAQQLTLWSGTPIKKDHVIEYTSANLVDLRDIPLWTNALTRPLLYAENQATLINDELYVWMMGRGLTRMYREKLGIDPPFFEHYMNGNRLYVSRISRSDWEQKSARLLEGRRGYSLINRGHVSRVASGKFFSLTTICGQALIGQARIGPSLTQAVNDSYYFSPAARDLVTNESD